MPRRSPGPARPSPATDERVRTLEARLAEAVAERDQALADVARLSAELDALRLARVSEGEAEPLPLPVEAGVEGVPLRYAVADAVHARVKGPLRWLKGLRRSTS